MLLIEAGSSSFEAENKLKGEPCINAVAQQYYDHFLKPEHGKQDLGIIISHPDKDHFNLVPTIVRTCLSKGIKVAFMYLGGAESFYRDKQKKKEQKLKQELETKKESKKVKETMYDLIQMLTKGACRIIYPAATDNSKLVAAVENPYKLLLLPALKITTEEDKNDGSLIAVCVFDSKCCWFTGDATKKTIQHIEKTVNLNDYNVHGADVFIASHHGANTENSNEETFLELVNPLYVVFSSDIRNDCFHPRKEVIWRCLNLSESRLKQVAWHTICAGEFENCADWSEVRHKEKLLYNWAEQGVFAVMSDNNSEKKDKTLGNYNNYGLIATDKGLYCTLTQGNMTFRLVRGMEDIAPPECSKGKSKGSTQAEHVLNVLPIVDQKFGDIILNARVISMVGLLKDMDPVAIRSTLLIVQSIGNSLSARDIDFSGNVFTDEIVDAVVALIKGNTRISSCRLLKMVFQLNDQTKNAKALLRAAWNNRGLELDPDM